jgi:hypothetical protein
MNESIRAKLIELARNKRTTTYSELNEALGLGYNLKKSKDRNILAKELEEISVFEFYGVRPLLSILVNRNDTKKPGKGFYKMYGRLFDKNWKRKYTNDSFDIELTTECFKFWRDIKNCRNYRLIK